MKGLWTSTYILGEIKEKLLLQNNTDMLKSVFTKLQSSRYQQNNSIVSEHNHGTLTN